MFEVNASGRIVLIRYVFHDGTKRDFFTQVIMREVQGLNPDQGIDYPDLAYFWCPSFPPRMYQDRASPVGLFPSTAFAPYHSLILSFNII
jgi:hypothetical protein